MQDLQTLEMDLNAMIARGEMVEATEKYYADDCTFQEGNKEARPGGKAAHIGYLKAIFASVTAVNGLTLHSQTAGDGVTMSEWTFDLSTTNGPVLWNEVLRRRWVDGQVVSERYSRETAPVQPRRSCFWSLLPASGRLGCYTAA